MIGHAFSGDIIYKASDVTAGVFLIMLIISVTLQTTKRTALAHLYAAMVLTLAGIFTRLSAETMVLLPELYEWKIGVNLKIPAVCTTAWLMSFAMIMLGITESVTHIIYMNEGGEKRCWKSRITAYFIITAAGMILFVLTHNINVLSSAILAHFIYNILHIRRNWSDRTMREYIRASAVAMIMFALPLAFDNVRLTGLGLSVMMIIIGEQYHNHIRQDLAKAEAALAKSRVQLLADQISPHYIYNSLQSINGLYSTDPQKAREAIDIFSSYLRGNLESLTEDDFIPFSRELEHTQAYLELERLGGLRRFVAEYNLEVTDFMLPPLVLQPVVENAVKHGAARAYDNIAQGEESATRINIITRERDGNICIEVTDSAGKSGDASEKGSLANSVALESAKNRYKTKSVGLENVRTRLEIQCGGSLDISSSDGGTKVTIKLPKIAKNLP